MTMTDNKCDVCNVNPPIGVASTMIPYSCAYCKECASRHAQPIVVFLTWFDLVGVNFEKLYPDLENLVVTFSDGRYQTYREWATCHVH
jgi:predicted metal-binding protein